MSIIDKLAEQHIIEAQRRGEFDNLPGAGKPLKLDDDSMVPPELRAGYRLLKNSGHLPPELHLRKEISDVQQLITASCNEEDRSRLNKRLHRLQTHLALLRGDGIPLSIEAQYQDKLINKFKSHK